MREKLRPALFAAIVAAYLVFGIAYATKTPTWEAPDEPAHFNYIRHVGQHVQLPILRVGDYDQAYLEKLKASRFPLAMSIDSVRYESWQPPLYYILSGPLYWASKDLSLAEQVVALRLFSVLLGAILLVISYKLARTLAPKDDLLALALPGFIGALPQHIAVAASVSNDTMSEVVVSLILLVLIRRIFDPTSRLNRVSLGVLLGLALLTKSTIYVSALLIPVGLLLREYNVSGRRIRIGFLTKQIATVFGIALLISGWWFIRNALVYGDLDVLGSKRHDLVVQGQPLTGAFDLAFAKFFVTGTFKSFWAQFGWMGVLADERTYTLLGILSLAAIAGLILFLLRSARRPDSLTHIERLGLLLLGTTFLLVLGIMVAYNFRYIQTQGRYMFPAIIPIAVFFIFGLREIVAERYAPFFFAALYFALVALDYISLTRFILPQLAG